MCDFDEDFLFQSLDPDLANEDRRVEEGAQVIKAEGEKVWFYSMKRIYMLCLYIKCHKNQVTLRTAHPTRL